MMITKAFNLTARPAPADLRRGQAQRRYATPLARQDLQQTGARLRRAWACHATMMSVAVIALWMAALAAAQQNPNHAVAPDQPVRFAAVDVYVDSGEEALAAYQFELTAEEGDFKIVGIEGGEHAAFAEPPYYDPKALSQNRVIIAAFNTGDDVPIGRARVARVHVQMEGNQTPEYVVKLDVAASADGEPIEAAATAEPTEQGEES